MLSAIGIWVAIALMGIVLGISFDFIPARGRRGDWPVFLVVALAMIVCAGLLGAVLGGHLV